MTVAIISGQSFECGHGFYSNSDGCCPTNINGSVYYPDARSCYPILTSAGVRYADPEGCYPDSNGTYRALGENCTRECEVECFNTTTNATTASPSPSSSPTASSTPSTAATPASTPSSSPAPITSSPSPSNSSAPVVGTAAPSPTSSVTPSSTATPSYTPSTSATPSVSPSVSPAANATTCSSLNRSPLPCSAPIQPFEIVLLEIRPVELNCFCNGTSALLGQSTSNSSSTSDLALDKICGTTCSSNLCNDSCLRVLVAENSTEATTSNDVQLLNYALTLEHLEATFYTEGLMNLTEPDFEAAGFSNQTYVYFTLIRDHEQTHVSVLESTITMLGGTPVQACQYNFTFTNVSQFVETAMELENVGVTAYDGAVAFLTSAELQTTSATIATVEARQASYLNLLNNLIPFPNAFDVPEPIATIFSLASAFIVSCPDAASTQVLEIIRSRSSQ